ncbi:MAG: hypothetical protein ACXWZS_08885, partial [Gemmatirosa sp.]
LASKATTERLVHHHVLELAEGWEPDVTEIVLLKFRGDLQFTRAYHDALPEWLKPHLACRIVERLEPIQQAHTIEGLVMGEA